MKDIIGIKFNRLTIIKDSGKRRNKNIIYECLCECGNTRFAERYALVNGISKSCGCLKKERLKGKNNHNFRHGHTSKKTTRTYNTWRGMINRCLNPSSSDYEDYGKRGIKISESWLSFTIFLKDMGLRPKGKTLDRIDTNGNYCKENCRWATKKEQENNKRRNN